MSYIALSIPTSQTSLKASLPSLSLLPHLSVTPDLAVWPQPPNCYYWNPLQKVNEDLLPSKATNKHFQPLAFWTPVPLHEAPCLGLQDPCPWYSPSQNLLLFQGRLVLSWGAELLPLASAGSLVLSFLAPPSSQLSPEALSMSLCLVSPFSP